jgi:hypothetical protein
MSDGVEITTRNRVKVPLKATALGVGLIGFLGLLGFASVLIYKRRV